MKSVFGHLKYRLWTSPRGRKVALAAVWCVARVWRRLLIRTRFVAVTGSLGKTTAKEHLRTILASRARTAATLENQNDRFGVPRTLLRVRPWHRYAVIEIGVSGPGQMAALAGLVRPHVALLLGVGKTHSTSFPDLDTHAEEKAQLLTGLRPDGACVANADDDRVLGILSRWTGRRISFGCSFEADVVAGQVRASWPGKLEFTIRTGGKALPVKTQLVGAHWVYSVLGATAAGLACGVSLQDCIVAVESVVPFPGRLQPVELPGGVTMLRDDYNASWTATEAALAVLAEARVGRRVLVLSDFSDFRGDHRARRKFLAERLPGRCDHCVLIGEGAEYGKRRLLDQGMAETGVSCFTSVPEAAVELGGVLRPGDLVLLKGRTTDHVSRVYFGLRGTVGCVCTSCRRTVLCDFCPDLRFVDSGGGEQARSMVEEERNSR